MTEYGKKLKEAREKAGLSIRSVAKKAGISEAHLRFIEKGERDTKLSTLRSLAKIIGADEKILIEKWFEKHLSGFDYSDLSLRIPEGISFEQLEEIYMIDEAKKILEELKLLKVSQTRSLSPKKINKIRIALENAIGFITELEQVSHSIKH